MNTTLRVFSSFTKLTEIIKPSKPN